MSWQNETRWIPDDPLPVLVVAEREKWPKIREWISANRPGYPIKLAVPMQAMYAEQFDRVIFQVDAKSKEHLKWPEWTEHLKCRINTRSGIGSLQGGLRNFLETLP